MIKVYKSELGNNILNVDKKKKDCIYKINHPLFITYKLRERFIYFVFIHFIISCLSSVLFQFLLFITIDNFSSKSGNIVG